MKSKVTFKSLPTEGAIVKYQTCRSRERGEEARSPGGPTTVSEKIDIGRYHIWTERKGKVTSNKNIIFTITEEYKTVTLVEDFLNCEK